MSLLESQSLPSSVDTWSCSQVAQWLKRNGFEDYMSLFSDEHKIDGKCLLTLNEEDLRSPPIQLPILGDLKRIMIAIRRLQRENSILVHDLIDTPIITSLTRAQLNHNHQHMNHHAHNSSSGDEDIMSNNLHHPLIDERSINEEEEEEESYFQGFLNKTENSPHLNGNNIRREFKPEIWKAIVSMGYFFLATWITAIVMVIVHDRVPDMRTYPPLPDIFLDNVPLIPWAFKMCEVCGLILFILWCLILIFHKHRFILIRRMFSLYGSVFLLRCVTMLITSLSVPGKHLQCQARPYDGWYERLFQAFYIWQGGGMSLKGVRSCGDYMFSGHTVVLTLLNFFITEYTPPHLYFIHTISWVLNLFGIFFILAAHEHYSIDVFIAFYISTRLFLYYHTLANHGALYQSDRKRTRIWFPLFYFFESKVKGIVPNEFESPFESHSFSFHIHFPKMNYLKYLSDKLNQHKSNKSNKSNTTSTPKKQKIN